jgi:hypothetical protein
MGHQARQAHQGDVPTSQPTRRTSFSDESAQRTETLRAWTLTHRAWFGNRGYIDGFSTSIGQLVWQARAGSGVDIYGDCGVGCLNIGDGMLAAAVGPGLMVYGGQRAFHISPGRPVCLRRLARPGHIAR